MASMEPGFSNPRFHRDWLSYKRESRLADRLDDRTRVAQMQELYVLYLMLQRAKSAEQLQAEARASHEDVGDTTASLHWRISAHKTPGCREGQHGDFSLGFFH